jgi:hypothetical protein
MDILSIAKPAGLAYAAMHNRQQVRHAALSVACGRERAIRLTGLPAETYTHGMTPWAVSDLQL